MVCYCNSRSEQGSPSGAAVTKSRFLMFAGQLQLESLTANAAPTLEIGRCLELCFARNGYHNVNLEGES